MPSPIILDRDGVINFDSEAYVKSPEEWVPIPGSLEAIGLLTQAGHQIFVATNQSGIARGYYTEETLFAMHAKMDRLLAPFSGHIEKVFYCPHGPDEGCACRKPKPGLLHAIAAAYEIDLTQSYFVGDAYRDVQAAQAVGAKPLLVRTGKGEQTVLDHPVADIAVFADLLAAAKHILITK